MFPRIMAEWNTDKDSFAVLLLNTENIPNLETNETWTRFCDRVNLPQPPHRNFIHGAYLGPEPDGQKQFMQEYIPHVTVFSKDGKFVGNKVEGGRAVELALSTL